MKKSLLSLCIALCCVFTASAQCTVDTTHFTSGVYVYPTSLPCIQQGVAFSGTVSLKVPDSVDAHAVISQIPQGSYYVHIDSMKVDSITGFPAGITAADYPAFGGWLYAHQYGCSSFTGTTGAAIANYPLAIHGRACGYVILPVVGRKDTCMDMNFSSFFPYSVDVCAGPTPPVCTPDTTHFAAGQFVYPDSLPCIVPGATISEQISIHIPDSIDVHNFYSAAPANTFYAYIDSMRIDSLTGMPAGISAATNPGSGVWLHGGRYGCGIFTGSTHAPGAEYPLHIYGRGCIHGTFPIIGALDTCQTGDLSAFINYSLTVCASTGMVELSSGIGLNVYPNPNQGAFTVTVSSADRISGQLSVMDQLGRTIHTQSVDVTGTKNIPLQLGNVSAGVYVLVVQTTSGKTVKEFAVK